MKVRFKNGHGVLYEVIDPTPVIMHDETIDELTECVKINVLGYVAMKLLELVIEDEKYKLN